MTQSQSPKPEERTGEHFSLEKLLEARRRTREALQDIAAAIRPGMVEEDAVQLATDMLKERGMRRGWHKILVRFGANTLKNFSEASEPGTVLRDDDIFFIDIGPVFDGYEGDAGQTFVVGNDPEMARCARDAREVFRIVHDKWRREGLTGQELYAFAAKTAADLGWELNLKMDGHRLSDFPHNVYHAGTLADVPFRPSANLWVLEIQIRHPGKAYGAFFEDLLLEDA